MPSTQIAKGLSAVEMRRLRWLLTHRFFEIINLKQKVRIEVCSLKKKRKKKKTITTTKKHILKQCFC